MPPPVKPHDHTSFSRGGVLPAYARMTSLSEAVGSGTGSTDDNSHGADYIGPVLVTGVPAAGATIIATSATTAQWSTGGAVTIYWPMLVLSSVA